MAYYHVCPDCGSALDPGERCDCHRPAAIEVAPAPEPKTDAPSAPEHRQTA